MLERVKVCLRARVLDAKEYIELRKEWEDDRDVAVRASNVAMSKLEIMRESGAFVVYVHVALRMGNERARRVNEFVCVFG